MSPIDGLFDGWTHEQIVGAVGLLVLVGAFLGLVFTIRKKGK